MTIILNIETSTKNCSFSIAKNGTTFFAIEKISEKFSHAEKIHCFIYYAIEANLLKFSDIKAICINKGPGSFTGLKIGLSIAKGLCYGLNKPLLTVGNISLLIEGIRFNKGIMIVIIYTIAQELYISAYNENKTRLFNHQIFNIKKISFQEWEKYKIYHLGNKIRFSNFYIETSIYFLSEIYPSSQKMAFISYKYFQNQKTETLSNFEPYYYK